MACFDERLITEVEQFPALYCPSVASYHNKNIKENCWQSVANALNITVSTAKDRWKNLRDKYVRQKKKLQQVQVSGSARVDFPRWPLMESLKFIEPFIQPRRTSCNISADRDNDQNINFEDDTIPTNLIDFTDPGTGSANEEETVTLNLHHVPSNTEESPSTSTSTLSSPLSAPRSTCDQLPKKTKKRHACNDELDAKIIDLLEDKTDNGPEALFAMSIVSRMKALPPKKLSIFKLSVLTKLHELEFEE